VSFLKRLFGFVSRSEVVKPQVQSPNVRLHSAAPAARTVLVSWQEVIDSRSSIAGYRLPASPVLAGSVISGPQLLDALEGEKVRELAERRLVLVPLTVQQWKSADFRSLVSPQIFFQLVGSQLSPNVLGEVIREIRASGAKVGVDAALFGMLEAAGEMVDLLVLEAQGIDLAVFEEKIRTIRQGHPKLLLVVDGVDSWAEFRYFQAQGIGFCMGGFAATPDQSEQSSRMSQSRLVVLDMLNQLRSDVDLAKVAATAKRDPAVVLKLLEMANSPLSGLSRRVSGLEDAIMLLGRDAVYRWLTLALFRIDAQGGRDETLLVIALSRASFLESLAPKSDKKVAGELFLVGMLSVVDSLLGLPMVQVLEKMHLPDEVAAALLRSEGRYARFLLLTIAMERCRIEYAITLAGLLEIDPAHLLNFYSEAMKWATSDLQG